MGSNMAILLYTATVATLTDLGFLWFREFYLETSPIIQVVSSYWVLFQDIIQDIVCDEFRMGPRKVYFDSMVSKSRNHIVRAKVISKYTRNAREGKQKYQRLLLIDEKGLTMKVMLFGHNVDHFDEIITEDECYDMSNLVVSQVAASFQSYPGEKQIYINTSSSIKKVDKGELSSHFASKFSKISDVSGNALPHNSMFDMIMVVLHYIPRRKVLNKKTNTNSDLSALYITDDSCSEAIVLSLWNKLALSCETFADKDPCGAVISVTGLQIKEFKGFAITTNYFSKINFNPTEAIADELRKWFETNRDIIVTTTGITRLKKESRPDDMPISTIEHVSGLKPTEITSEDVVKIAAYVPDLSVDRLHLTLTCNICGKACDVPPEASYLCNSCHNYSSSVAKIFFDFITTDGTGTLRLSTNSTTSEQLLKIKSSTFYNMSDKDRAFFVDKVIAALRTKKTEMLLSPVETILANNNKIVWWLKDML